jgi:hypothetical protein
MYRGMHRSLAQTRNSCHQLPERAETLSYTYTANPRGLARFDLRGVEGVEHRIALPALARTYARPLRVIRIAGPILSSSHTSWNQRRITRPSPPSIASRRTDSSGQPLEHAVVARVLHHLANPRGLQ